MDPVSGASAFFPLVNFSLVGIKHLLSCVFGSLVHRADHMNIIICVIKH